MAAPAIEIAPSLYRIPTAGNFINSFALLETDGSVTLIDCGLSRAPSRIVRALAWLNRHPSDVTGIILTHAHQDHAGGAATLVAEASLAGVTVHERDAAYLTAGTPPKPVEVGGVGRLINRLASGRFAPVEVSQTLHDGDFLDLAGGLRVIHTPGHTPGHVSLLHEAAGVLVTGDSIFNVGFGMRWPYGAFCNSLTQAKQTAEKLADLEYTTAGFTHGPEIVGTGREAIRAFLRKHR